MNHPGGLFKDSLVKVLKQRLIEVNNEIMNLSKIKEGLNEALNLAQKFQEYEDYCQEQNKKPITTATEIYDNSLIAKNDKHISGIIRKKE